MFATLRYLVGGGAVQTNPLSHAQEQHLPPTKKPLKKISKRLRQQQQLEQMQQMLLVDSETYSNLRYEHTKLSHSRLLLHQISQSSVIDECNEETLDKIVPLTFTSAVTPIILPSGYRATTLINEKSNLISTGTRIPTYYPTTTIKRHSSSPPPSTTGSVPPSTLNCGGYSTYLPTHDYSLCDSCRPLRFHSSHIKSGSPSSVSQKSFSGVSTRYLNLNSNTSNRFNSLPPSSILTPTPPPQTQQQQQQQQQLQTKARVE